MYAQTKRQAHDLIERIAPGQVAAVVGLMETMLDPIAWAIANAPVDDEPEIEGGEASGGRVQGVGGPAPGERASSEQLLAELRFTSGAGAAASKSE